MRSIQLRTQQLAVRINSKTICHDLNIKIHAGEIWGILGPNGSGKTTLLHVLAGLHPIDTGLIWLGENKLAHLSAKMIAQHIAILFQDTHYAFPQTVEEYCLNSRYPHHSYFDKMNQQDKNIVAESLGLMELSEFKQQLITKLSGGEKRRLAIAAVLAQTPKIFLLDEPTNHLDLRQQMRVMNTFCKLASDQHAVVMVLHDIHLAASYCSHVLLLFPKGEMIHGSKDALLTVENLTRLYDIQKKEHLCQLKC